MNGNTDPRVLEATTRAKRVARHAKLLDEARGHLSWRAGTGVIIMVIALAIVIVVRPDAPWSGVGLLIAAISYLEFRISILERRVNALTAAFRQDDAFMMPNPAIFISAVK